jgi:hypothetical protein
MRRRFVTYTFSTLIDNETTSIVNPRKYRTVSSLDQTHIMRVAATYELPWRFTGHGLNRLWRQVGAGSSLGGYFIAESGLALGITHPHGRPICIRNAAKSGPVSERLGDRFDPVTRPPSQSVLRYRCLPALTFPIAERLRLQVRMEAQGLTNTPNFAAPGTNLSSIATFGVITAASGSRQMQGSASIFF